MKRKYRIRQHDYENETKYSVEYISPNETQWTPVSYEETRLMTYEIEIKRKEFTCIEDARKWINRDKQNIGFVVEEFDYYN